jgi:heme exporter protein C
MQLGSGAVQGRSARGGKEPKVMESRSAGRAAPPLDLKTLAAFGVGAAILGVAGILAASWMVFFWVPTEATMGIVQRVFYIHPPVAWVAELAFGVTALAGIIHLWLGDDRADAAAVSAAEGGLYFCAALLVTGSMWGRIAWGSYWEWEPRLTLTLLLFFIFLGYFMVRHAAESAERGKRLSAVVAVVGALNIPVIHMSVYWFRSLHPEPVILRPDGPSADPRMVATILAGVAAYATLFVGLWSLRYAVELGERRWAALSTGQMGG